MDGSYQLSIQWTDWETLKGQAVTCSVMSLTVVESAGMFPAGRRLLAVGLTMLFHEFTLQHVTSVF